MTAPCQRFPVLPVAYGGGTSPAHFITCPSCGQRERTIDSSPKKMPAELIARIFRNKGWRVGANERGDLCPRCAAPKPKEATMTKAASQSEVPPEPTAPREMTKDDRRVVFLRLNDVYLDEAKGYCDDWTDASVARDLGVPRAWVEAIREENFGPVRSSEAVAQLLAELAPLRKEMEELFAGAREHLEKALAIEGRLAAFDKRIARIERAVA